MNKYHHSHQENQKRYGKSLALKINKDSLDFIGDVALKKNIEQEKPRDFNFRIDLYEKEKLINVIRKLFYKNKLIGTSQKKYKLISPTNTNND